jgi:AcrR family transcriptional regulator
MSAEADQDGSVSVMSWTERAADRSPLMQQWRSRNERQMTAMVEAAKRLIARNGGGFTTQELAREAGVAVQTFYRHFGGKDQLLLATLEDLHVTYVAQYEAAARDLADPLARLRFYVVSALMSLDGIDRGTRPARFITAEHWRLVQAFPDEMSLAVQPIVDLFARELRAAQEQGLIAPSDPNQSAELMVMLVRGAYHQYAFKATSESTAAIAESVWKFCLQGIGGPIHADSTGEEGVAMPPA